jgi:hypothetical protein
MRDIDTGIIGLRFELQGIHDQKTASPFMRPSCAMPGPLLLVAALALPGCWSAPIDAFMKANQALATQLGLINWSVDTWTLRPAINIQYVVPLYRSIITLSSDPTYFYTEDFNSSNRNVQIDGSSGSVANKIDVDVPLGVELYGHELRSGGYLSRTDLFGDLRSGLGVHHMNEIHGRVVLDFLNQYWKFQWIGVGASYLWGPNITGWTVGADIAFRF